MPLQSAHFRGDPRLELTLVSDPAHVVPGDRGPFVTKIQTALAIISHAAIPPSESGACLYGPATAAAVLAFKRTRRIINSSYQNEADNIVGKMTIAALDEEMLSRENVHPPVPRQTPVPVDDFESPASGLPEDLKATLRISNALRTPQNHYLAPIIPWGQGSQSLRELSRLIAASREFAIILEVYNRMSRYGLWRQVHAIRDVFRGTGSHGFKCDAVNHDAFLIAAGRHTSPRSASETLLMSAPFCRDLWNVHGPRDSFRENVTWGPGLHICITQPAHRRTEPCDIHIDEYQQGSDCVNGYCIPRVLDARTIAHLISVGPWLADEAKRHIGEYLRRKGIPVPW